MNIETIPSTATPSNRLWICGGTDEPTRLVDDARATTRPGLGFRRSAAYRRFGAEGGRPGLTAEHLESARLGLDRHRGRQWRTVDEDTIAEIRHRSAVPGDIGARRSNEIPSWFRCEGSDGARIVPRRLQPLVALIWWAYASGRFGVLASTVELGVELGVDPRTIRAWRAECVALGLLQRGEHAYVGPDGVEIPHHEVCRTWRPGRFARPCDRGRNLYRPGPVLEAFAAATVADAGARRPLARGEARLPKRSAKAAAGALRRAARLSAYRRTGEVWERETGRARSPSTTPAPRGPRPISPERMARTAVARATAPTAPKRATAIVRIAAIARIKSPATPDPSGPSDVRGQGPRTPKALHTRHEGADCSPAAPAAGASPSGDHVTHSTQTPAVRPEAPPRRVAGGGPTRDGLSGTTQGGARRLVGDPRHADDGMAALFADLAHTLGFEVPPDAELSARNATPSRRDDERDD